MKTMDLNYSVSFNVPPADVYSALMDPKKHAEFTEAPAEISQETGGKFSLHGGYIYGENIELVKDKKIVQSWRTQSWEPEDHYSTVTYLMEPDKGGTKLTFSHTNIPEINSESIAAGWYSHYWEPMKKYFEKK
jgi:activator of HSP90 ATPase